MQFFRVMKFTTTYQASVWQCVLLDVVEVKNVFHSLILPVFTFLQPGQKY